MPYRPRARGERRRRAHRAAIERKRLPCTSSSPSPCPSTHLIPHQTILQNVELALTLSGVGKAERTRRAKEALHAQGSIEWVVIVVCIAVALIAALVFLSGEMNNKINTVANTLKNTTVNGAHAGR